MKIRYLATFRDASYFGYDAMDKMDAFESIEKAKYSLECRYHGSDWNAEYALNPDGYYVPWNNGRYTLFPAVTREATMELYEVMQGDLGQLFISHNPSIRLSFGPRGGVKSERY